MLFYGLTRNFCGKKRSLNIFEAGGGGAKLFRYIFFASPPLQVFVNGLHKSTYLY